MMKELDVNGFCDLNITHKPDSNLLNRIIEFNYRAIALNWTVDATKNQSSFKKKKNKNAGDPNLEIFPKELSESFQTIVQEYGSKLKVFLRITIIFNSPDQLKSVTSSPEIKKYDIIAVLPKTNDAYQHACSNHSVDLISFQIGITDYKPKGKMHKQMVDRSAYYEICYSQALKSSAMRQETFTMAQYYLLYGKSKNAIVSSGSSHYLDLRNPYDVANLGIVFGLSSDKAHQAVSRNCQLLLLAAAGRRYGKTAITVELIDDDKVEEPKEKRQKLSDKNIPPKNTPKLCKWKTIEMK